MAGEPNLHWMGWGAAGGTFSRHPGVRLTQTQTADIPYCLVLSYNNLLAAREASLTEELPLRFERRLETMLGSASFCPRQHASAHTWRQPRLSLLSSLLVLVSGDFNSPNSSIALLLLVKREVAHCLRRPLRKTKGDAGPVVRHHLHYFALFFVFEFPCSPCRAAACEQQTRVDCVGSARWFHVLFP